MSVRIRVCTTLDVPPAAAWSAIERIETHVEWMAEAESLAFIGARRSGVGTEFECRTRVGPVRLRDVMTVTEWRPREAMGITHVGVVTGSGKFTLRGRRGQRTRFCWEERLAFPWWMGGVVGERIAKPVLKRIWRANLVRLKTLAERDT